MGFVVGSFGDLQQFGFGLAAAILIDVTIVRALLLPSALLHRGPGSVTLKEAGDAARIDRGEEPASPTR